MIPNCDAAGQSAPKVWGRDSVTPDNGSSEFSAESAQTAAAQTVAESEFREISATFRSYQAAVADLKALQHPGSCPRTRHVAEQAVSAGRYRLIALGMSAEGIDEGRLPCAPDEPEMADAGMVEELQAAARAADIRHAERGPGFWDRMRAATERLQAARAALYAMGLRDRVSGWEREALA